MKYGELNLGQIEAIVNKLGGIDGVQRFLSGQIVVKPATPPDFQVWKSIKLGTGLKTADDFRQALKKGKKGIGDWGNDILGKPAFTVAQTETEVDLVLVTVAELGFEDGAEVKDIYAKALELGLQLCPNEVGPQLRLQYTDQPKGEWMLIGMEPISDSGGDLSVFFVKHDDGGKCWLNANFGHPGCFWRGSFRFVFVKPRGK